MCVAEQYRGFQKGTENRRARVKHAEILCGCKPDRATDSGEIVDHDHKLDPLSPSADSARRPIGFDFRGMQ
jgi:hypothetical protein